MSEMFSIFMGAGKPALHTDESVFTKSLSGNVVVSMGIPYLPDAFQFFSDKLCAQLAVSSGTHPAAKGEWGIRLIP